MQRRCNILVSLVEKEMGDLGLDQQQKGGGGQGGKGRPKKAQQEAAGTTAPAKRKEAPSAIGATKAKKAKWTDQSMEVDKAASKYIEINFIRKYFSN